MLFNSFQFIFLFLPITLLIFYAIGGRGHHRIATAWLVGASLFFYAYWNPMYLGLMIASILFNYSIGVALGEAHGKEQANGVRWLLGVGVLMNLTLLGYFKYANFFVDNLNAVAGSRFHLDTIILPLAISFFTFQQIAFLVDAFKGETREYNFLHYCLFVTFFPQLIAGPIVHHREILPQFARISIYRFRSSHLAVGLTIFVFGLFKKVVVADGVAAFVGPVFTAPQGAEALSFGQAWSGVLAYTLQLYFDFSGYSDMAIGLGRMFGIRIPINFYSPYKAANIIDFWRRWHITLSRFLRDYLYFSLGGNRKGPARRHVNLLITMLLGGLWHGAGWTFVIWGGLHGFYLIVNHLWRGMKKPDQLSRGSLAVTGRVLSHGLTFLAIVVGWVFFRAENVGSAGNILQSMAGLNGFAPVDGDLWFLVLLPVVWFAPNTQQIMLRYRPALEIYRGEIKPWMGRRLQWRMSAAWGVGISVAAILAVLSLCRVSEFLYFQF